MKDLCDICVLLFDYDFGVLGIDMVRIFDVMRVDWGFEHMIHCMFVMLIEWIGDFVFDGVVVEWILVCVEVLVAVFHVVLKSVKWKMCARVGERVCWYEEFEEVRG